MLYLIIFIIGCVGLDTQIQEIKESVELPLTHPEYYEEMGIKPPKGVILYGPPGTGKTLLAKAVANQTSATFLRVVGSELIQKYLVSVCSICTSHINPLTPNLNAPLQQRPAEVFKYGFQFLTLTLDLNEIHICENNS
jgi:hypothetical protein